jgi:hypothetical protein
VTEPAAAPRVRHDRTGSRPADGAGVEPAPRFLTVDEAARALRISRTAAYELTARWLATEGREGVPCIRLGRTLRVPQAAIDRMAQGYDAPEWAS